MALFAVSLSLVPHTLSPALTARRNPKIIFGPTCGVFLLLLAVQAFSQGIQPFSTQTCRGLPLTEVTAAVPTGAKTGPVGVETKGGIGISSATFWGDTVTLTAVRHSLPRFR